MRRYRGQISGAVFAPLRRGLSGSCIAAVVSAVCLFPAGSATGMEDLRFGFVNARGYAWSQVRIPGARQPSERDVEIVEGAVHQRFDFLAIAETARIGAFVQADFSRDTKRLDYNNEFTPALGLLLGMPLSTWGYVQVGGKYEREGRYVTARHPSSLVGFLDWSTEHLWQPAWRGAPSGPLRYRFITQGTLRYPSSQETRESRNAFLEGKAIGGIDWFVIPDNVTFNTFVGLEFKVDTREIDSKNQLEPGVGLLFRFEFDGHTIIETGAKLVNEYRFRSGSSETGPIVFVNLVTVW